MLEKQLVQLSSNSSISSSSTTSSDQSADSYSILFLDWDCCMDAPLCYEQLNESPYWEERLEVLTKKFALMDKDVAKQWLAARRPELIEFFKQLTAGTKVIVITGSNRQTGEDEVVKMSNNIPNGRSFVELPKFCKEMGWTFFPVTFPDTTNNLATGFTIERANKLIDALDTVAITDPGYEKHWQEGRGQIEQKEKFTVPYNVTKDGLKQNILPALLKRLFAEHKELAAAKEPTRIFFFDDNKTYLDKVRDSIVLDHKGTKWPLDAAQHEFFTVQYRYEMPLNERCTDPNKIKDPSKITIEIKPNKITIPYRKDLAESKTKTQSSDVLLPEEIKSPFLTDTEATRDGTQIPMQAVAEFVNKEYLSKPYDDNVSWKNQHDDKPLKLNESEVQRHNNGIVNAVRCASYVPHVIDFLAANAKEAKLQQFCQSLTAAQRNWLQKTMLFTQTGRKSGLGFWDNAQKYKEYKQAATQNVKKYGTSVVEGTAPEAKGKNTALKDLFYPLTIDEFLEAFERSGDPSYTPTRIEQKYLHLIFTLAHTLDSLRLSERPQQFHGSLLSILNKAGGIKNEEDLIELERFVADALSCTGNRMYCSFSKDKARQKEAKEKESIKAYQPIFATLSNDIGELIKTVGSIQPPAFKNEAPSPVNTDFFKKPLIQGSSQNSSNQEVQKVNVVGCAQM